MSQTEEPRQGAPEIVVNGEARSLAQPSTLTALVESLGLHPEAVAVELNGRIVKRADYAATTLGAGDRVEVVRFVQGGAPCSRVS